MRLFVETMGWRIGHCHDGSRQCEGYSNVRNGSSVQRRGSRFLSLGRPIYVDDTQLVVRCVGKMFSYAPPRMPPVWPCLLVICPLDPASLLVKKYHQHSFADHLSAFSWLYRKGVALCEAGFPACCLIRGEG